MNGTASGGGYEIALACERILLVDDRSAAVSLPEVPLLGVLPGTGGLTRVVDKRKVRRDRADVFATKAEGVKGRTAVEWGLVDEAIPRSRFEETVRERAREAAAAVVAHRRGRRRRSRCSNPRSPPTASRTATSPPTSATTSSRSRSTARPTPPSRT